MTHVQCHHMCQSDTVALKQTPGGCSPKPSSGVSALQSEKGRLHSSPSPLLGRAPLSSHLCDCAQLSRRGHVPGAALGTPMSVACGLLRETQTWPRTEQRPWPRQARLLRRRGSADTCCAPNPSLSWSQGQTSHPGDLAYLSCFGRASFCSGRPVVWPPDPALLVSQNLDRGLTLLVVRPHRPVPLLSQRRWKRQLPAQERLISDSKSSEDHARSSALGTQASPIFLRPVNPRQEKGAEGGSCLLLPCK